jgi:hypothetical protein
MCSIENEDLEFSFFDSYCEDQLPCCCWNCKQDKGQPFHGMFNLGTGIKCLVYSSKDLQFKWPPLLCMFLVAILVMFSFSRSHCTSTVLDFQLQKVKGQEPSVFWRQILPFQSKKRCKTWVAKNFINCLHLSQKTALVFCHCFESFVCCSLLVY